MDTKMPVHKGKILLWMNVTILFPSIIIIIIVIFLNIFFWNVPNTVNIH